MSHDNEELSPRLDMYCCMCEP